LGSPKEKADFFGEAMVMKKEARSKVSPEMRPKP
jgi:hypothetical protein